MSEGGAERLAGRRAFAGRVLTLEVDRVRLPHGREVELEVVRHPPSVVLLPMPDADHVILVRQFRYAPNCWLWELPAGSLDPGERPEAAAARECHEEIGLWPARVERLAAFLPTPGYCDEEMIFYRLTGLERPERAALQDEDELLVPGTFAVDELARLVAAGEIRDMKTAVGIGLLGREPGGALRSAHS